MIPAQVQAQLAEAMGRHQAGQLAEAALLYRKILKQAPKLADGWYALGLAEMQTGKTEAAIAAWQKAVRCEPRHGAAWINLGIALAELARPAEAEQAFRQGQPLLPDLPEAYGNLAIVLGQLNRAAEGEEQARKALTLRPDDPDILNNLAMLLHQQQRLDEALAVYDRSLSLRPDNPRARFNRSLVLLQKGDWAEGWQEREWRLKGGVGNASPRSFPQPEWAGEDIAGKRILLYAEQGFGDSLQFLRFCQDVAKRGAEVVVELPKALARLATSTPGVAQVVTAGEPLPAFDLHMPLMSLPRILGTRVETVPAPIPYLTAPPSDWTERLDGAKLKVGLVWAGDSRSHDPLASAIDKRRSLSLAQFKPLLGMPGIQFVSLQKGPAAAQIRRLDKALRPKEVIEDGWDFADTAAAVQALDLVISVDTAVAHLAGALGKPVWILSRFDGCWRWLSDRSDTPWYPNARLFRQPSAEDWASVLERLADQLHSWCNAAQRLSS